jgi:hypothetical protein
LKERWPTKSPKRGLTSISTTDKNNNQLISNKPVFKSPLGGFRGLPKKIYGTD